MRKPTVLIADGLRLIREGTREILERSNRFTVVGEAGDGEEAPYWGSPSLEISLKSTTSGQGLQ